MLDDRFYWGTIRKAIVAFGNMFNNITIQRKDADGNIVQLQRVPLAYSPQQKFLAKIKQQPNVDTTNFQVILPRMGFEMVSLDYDPSRKISPIQQSRSINSSTSASAMYAPSPYNINVLLYIYAKNQDDGLQIIEQILPYFNPDYNLTIHAIPELKINNDLPILLNSIGFTDDYEGDMTTRRAIIWTLSFVIKLNFYGPLNRQGIINKVTTNTFNDPALSSRQSSISVQGTGDLANTIPTGNVSYLNTFEDF
jgi:T4-like virus Myoviridae tail sheath stabiliser